VGLERQEDLRDRVGADVARFPPPSYDSVMPEASLASAATRTSPIRQRPMPSSRFGTNRMLDDDASNVPISPQPNLEIARRERLVTSVLTSGSGLN